MYVRYGYATKALVYWRTRFSRHPEWGRSRREGPYVGQKLCRSGRATFQMRAPSMFFSNAPILHAVVRSLEWLAPFSG
jgi:hypothetical protein